MPKIETDSTNMDDSVEIPMWLTEAFEESRDYMHFNEYEPSAVDIHFRDRCREAAAFALSMGQLRTERHRIGFVPLSLNAYIQGLVKMTNVSLEPILKWLGVEELSQLGSAPVAGLARLARGVGIELREALIHLRIGFAEEVDGAPMSLLVARQRSTSGGRSTLEECESVLNEMESTYNLESLKELRRAEFEFRSRYKERTGL